MWAAVVGPSAGSTESEGCGPQGARGTAQWGTGVGGAGCKGGHVKLALKLNGITDIYIPVNLLDGIIRENSPNYPLLPPHV